MLFFLVSLHINTQNFTLFMFLYKIIIFYKIIYLTKCNAIENSADKNATTPTIVTQTF
jgi:hypothetical protein